DRRGSWKRRLEAALRTAWRRAYWPISPSSRTAWREACSIRTGPSSITCADPVPSGTPSMTGQSLRTRQCPPLYACAPGADGAEESGIRLEIASSAAPDRATRGSSFGENRIAAGRGFACAIEGLSAPPRLTPPQANPDIRHAPLPLRDPRRLSERRPQGGRLVEGFP